MKRYVEKLFDGSFEKEAFQQIDQMLDMEIEKKPSARDYDKISELTRAHAELSGEEAFIQEAAERGIRRLSEQIKKHPKLYRRKRIRIAVTVGIAAALLLTANTVTILAENQNIVSFIIEKTENSFSVQPIPKTVVELPTTPDDPYGIKAECAKYELEVEAPTYLPEGFVLWDVDVIEKDITKMISFKFHRDTEFLVLQYTELYDTNAKGNIPSDFFNIEEVTVNGKPAVTSKEDGQYTLLYYVGNMEYLLYSDSLSYAECDKIVASIKD
ncbi:MAG: DUF4367 domain-containing protein [Oscillospiraceae bacterium]|nr:DUF4367 domain-containing protein [Oscillospiraceae bacterium]